MTRKDDIRPISELKSHTAELVDEVERDRRPLMITQDGRARAVLLDAATWDQLQRSLAMLRIVAHAEEDFEAGRMAPTKDAFASARKAVRVKARRKRA